MSHTARPLLATLALAALLGGCSTPKKPTDEQISHYVADQLPPYVSIRKVDATFERIDRLGTTKLADGAWRITANLTLRTAEDLYAISPLAIRKRADFTRMVMAVEQFRVARIEAVNTFAASLGLLRDPAQGPMPSFRIAVATPQGGEVADRVTLLATPDGTGWKFVQLDAQTLDTAAVGEPLEALRRDNPTLALVLADSPEERDSEGREARFLNGLQKAPH